MSTYLLMSVVCVLYLILSNKKHGPIRLFAFVKYCESKTLNFPAILFCSKMGPNEGLALFNCPVHKWKINKSEPCHLRANMEKKI